MLRILKIVPALVLAFLLGVSGTLALGQATLVSIAVTAGTVTSIPTGNSAALTATGTYSDETTQNLTNSVAWSSSNSAIISVNSAGQATALKGSVAPVTITATSGTVSGSISLSANPQTVLYSADGSTLTVYDITLEMVPSVVTAVPYHTAVGGGNGSTSIPMTLSPDGKLLFIANPAYSSNNQSDFVLEVVDTATYKIIQEVSSGLCRPTGLAAKTATGSGISYLYVANAGASAVTGTAATCDTPGDNVQVYSFTSTSSTPIMLPPVTTLTSSTLAPTNTNAVPLVAAASTDPNDSFVYIGSTAYYNSTGTCSSTCLSNLQGTLTIIDANSNSVTNSIDLFLRAGGNFDWGISPLSLTVATSYPSWAASPVHTVFLSGTGYDSQTGKNGTYSWYMPDQCQTSPCIGGRNLIFPSPGPAFYSPEPATSSPSGLTTYAGDVDYLDAFSFVPGAYFSGCPSSCLPVTSVAATADAQYVFAGSYGEIDRLSPSTLVSDNTVTSVFPLALIISQAPEIKFAITNQVGTQITAQFTFHGNFQNAYGGSAANFYGYSFGGGNNNGGGGSASSPSIFTVTGTDNYSQQGTFTPNANITSDANNSQGTIIVPVAVGPETVTISAASSTVNVGSRDQFQSSSTNPAGVSVIWKVNGVVGGGSPFGTISPSGLYTAPSSTPPSAPNIQAFSQDTSGTASNIIQLTIFSPAQANLNPTALAFPSQTEGTTSAALSVTVTNTGNANLLLGAPALSLSGSGSTEFAIASGTTCTASLAIAPNGTCVVNVTFTPAGAAPYSATLTLTDNSGGASGATQPVALSGTGTTPPVPTATLNSTSLTFSNQTVGTTSAALSVTVTNTGTANLLLSSPALSLSGSGSTEFAIASGTTCTASLAIAPNGTCVINVTFKPAAAASYAATLTLTDNSGGASGATQPVALSGTGTTPPVPTATLNSTSLTFSNQTVGTTSAALSVTVTNTGTANLLLSSPALSLSGSGSTDFAIASGTTCTASLSIAPNGTCVIKVSFSPAAAASYAATLTLTDNSGGVSGATQSVALSGSGLASGATASVFPPSAALDAGGTQQFTPVVTNVSNGTVTWSVSGTGCTGMPCGSINSTGLYTAPAKLTVSATDTVIATLVADPSISGTGAVTLYLTPVLNTTGQTATVVPGQPATYNLTLAPNTGYLSGPLTISCDPRFLPTGVGCQAVTVQPSNDGASLALVLTTTGPSQTSSLRSRSLLVASLGFIFPFGVLVILQRRRDSKARIWFRLLLLGALLGLVCIIFTGCGTTGSFGQSASKNLGETPTGTFTIHIDGVGPSGATQEIGQVQLVVQ